MRRTWSCTNLGEERSKVKCEGSKSAMNMVCRRASKEIPVDAAAWGRRKWGAGGGREEGRKRLRPLPGAWDFITAQKCRF